MKISPKAGLWITTVLWLGVIAFSWGRQEYDLRHGTEVVLKTAPVDPRDLFRGDYVVLRYEISTLNLDSLGQSELVLERNATIFVSLVQQPERWIATAVHTEMPEEGIFLKGRVVRTLGRIAEISYGIESYFVPEGKGREIEQRYAAGNLRVVVRINRYGRGMIKILLIEE